MDRARCDCQGCATACGKPGEILWASDLEKEDDYVPRCRAGEVKWGRWGFDPKYFVMNHERGHQVDLLWGGETVREALAESMRQLAERRLAFDADDVGHFGYAMADLFNHLEAPEMDPLRILDATTVRYGLPEALTAKDLQKASGVYCVASGEHVKIGQSASIAKRIKELQTGSAHPLKVYAVLSRYRENEAALHRRFDHLRVQGEWFRMCEQIAVIVRDRRFATTPM